MSKINLFICHNPFHAFFSQMLCAKLFEGNDYTNIILLPNNSIPKREGFQYIVTEAGVVGKIRVLWQLRFLINKYGRKYRENFQIFLPHIEGIIGNYAYHSRSLKKLGVVLNFYYEGFVMINKNRAERSVPRRMLAKMLLSLSVFHYFIKYEDILPMNSLRIKNIYTPYPEMTPALDSKKIPFSFPRSSFQFGVGRVLIVGVPVGKVLKRSSEAMIDFLMANNPNDLFFFKPHYADRNHAFEKVALQKKFAYEYIESDKCIEELIEEVNTSIVVCTHFSSALVNLKVIYRERLRVIFLTNHEILDEFGGDAIQIANAIGVEIKIID